MMSRKARQRGEECRTMKAGGERRSGLRSISFSEEGEGGGCEEEVEKEGLEEGEDWEEERAG